MLHIALEGIDGCGKSTQVKVIISKLSEYNVKHSLYGYTSRENVFFKSAIIKWQEYCCNKKRPLRFYERFIQELLYSSNARYNWNNLNREKDIVIADRSIITAYVAHSKILRSTIASQIIIRITEFGLPVPDYVILYDTDPQIAQERIANRGIPANVDETLEAGSRMRKAFLEFSRSCIFPSLKNIEWIVIDASSTINDVKLSTLKTLDEILRKRNLI